MLHVYVQVYCMSKTKETWNLKVSSYTSKVCDNKADLDSS